MPVKGQTTPYQRDDAGLLRLIHHWPYPSFVMDQSGCCFLANEQFAGLKGKIPEEMIGQPITEEFKDIAWMNKMRASDRQMPDMDELTNSHEWKAVDVSGVMRYFELNWLPVDLPAGGKGLLCMTVDCTRNREAESILERNLEEKELVLQEVHHRVKNNMNNMILLLNLQAETTENQEAALVLRNAGLRLQGMMLTYDKLYRTRDYRSVTLGRYVSGLINELKETFPGHEQIQIHFNVEELVLNDRKMVYLGMILTELFTNAMKHAYPMGQAGSILIEIQQRDNHLLLTVQDFGRGIPGERGYKEVMGLGLSLVETLVIQMGGSMEVLSGNGVCVIVRFKKE